MRAREKRGRAEEQKYRDSARIIPGIRAIKIPSHETEPLFCETASRRRDSAGGEQRDEFALLTHLMAAGSKFERLVACRSCGDMVHPWPGGTCLKEFVYMGRDGALGTAPYILLYFLVSASFSPTSRISHFRINRLLFRLHAYIAPRISCLRFVVINKK